MLDITFTFLKSSQCKCHHAIDVISMIHHQIQKLKSIFKTKTLVHTDLYTCGLKYFLCLPSALFCFVYIRPVDGSVLFHLGEDLRDLAAELFHHVGTVSNVVRQVFLVLARGEHVNQMTGHHYSLILYLLNLRHFLSELFLCAGNTTFNDIQNCYTQDTQCANSNWKWCIHPKSANPSQ